MGGYVPSPSYEQVCTGRTGHAEVVQVTFNPEQISYREILDIFFAIHDPTTLNRQGNDVGPQYRSVIFTHADEQRREAEQTIRGLKQEGLWRSAVVTQVEPASTFHRAEDYHLNYFRNNPGQPYCTYVVGAKVAKFRQKFQQKVRRGAGAS
jgi:peptide-methionine (S)-S-oxide reductase